METPMTANDDCLDVPRGLHGRLLEGRVALVTGAGSERGIGRATAELFATHGAKVALLDLNHAGARANAERIGPGHLALGCDITDEAGCVAAARTVAERLGPIDVLVNSAAITARRAFFDVTTDEFDDMFRINVRGTYLMTRAVLPDMAKRRTGSVILLSSTAEQRGAGTYGSSHYAASKSAVSGLSRALGREFGPMGVRVNTIAPNLVDTDMSVGMSREERSRIEQQVPLRRSATAWDVAAAALYLASDLSAYTTGATIDVNGGFHIH
jgi:NAD(P)-dependent dehydrogenase (short-subunit alcohol dehydrogenase family)